MLMVLLSQLAATTRVHLGSFFMVLIFLVFLKFFDGRWLPAANPRNMPAKLYHKLPKSIAGRLPQPTPSCILLVKHGYRSPASFLLPPSVD